MNGCRRDSPLPPNYPRRVRIDIWSDIVCPWCYIGYTRLHQALEQYDGEVEIYHHAFELDRRAENDGSLTSVKLAEKYGIDVEQALNLMDDVTETAATVGLKYRLAETQHGNTRLAHRLLAAAAEVGSGGALLQRLFSAYFEAAEPVFTAEQLRPHAEAVGLPNELIDSVFNGDAFSDLVDEDRELAEQLNIRGVPFFAFNQRVGVSGAESVDVLLAAMAKAATPAAGDD